MEEEQVTMFTEQSWFYSGGQRSPDVGEEFRSEAYKELVISMREEARSRQWHVDLVILLMVAGNLDRPLRL
jgi:hypothetical protein